MRPGDPAGTVEHEPIKQTVFVEGEGPEASATDAAA
jgi:hypothetical protein